MNDTVPKPVPAQRQPCAASPGLRHKRILVVEDEYQLAEDMAADLRGLGAEVVGPVPSLEEGLAAISGPDAIDGAVLDVNLRGTTVFPLAEALAARGVPFVFATGYDRAFIPAAFDRVRLCEKPFDSRLLASTLFD